MRLLLNIHTLPIHGDMYMSVIHRTDMTGLTKTVSSCSYGRETGSRQRLGFNVKAIGIVNMATNRER